MKEFVNVFPTVVVVPIRQPETALISWFDNVYKWCEDNGVNLKFMNAWHNEKGEWASFDIPDEQQRFWFTLKWK
jgi:hypothetical protein